MIKLKKIKEIPLRKFMDLVETKIKAEQDLKAQCIEYQLIKINLLVK